MNLSSQVMDAMKVAMKSKDSRALQALRAVKSALLLAQTESGSKEALSEEQEMKLLQKLVKQRKDSAVIYKEQGRDDLADPELVEAGIIAQFLPEQMSASEIETIVSNVIEQTGAQGMKDMGKVMGQVNAKVAGKADGGTVAKIVKAQLA